MVPQEFAESHHVFWRQGLNDFFVQLFFFSVRRQGAVPISDVDQEFADVTADGIYLDA